MNDLRHDPRPDRGPVLRLDGIRVDVTDGRQARTVVHDLSLTVDAGEMVALMGPSGSGKTTVVDVACGLVIPTHGEVAVEGHRPGPVRAASGGWWAEQRRSTIGVVHQRLNLLTAVSARENVAIAL